MSGADEKIRATLERVASRLREEVTSPGVSEGLDREIEAVLLKMLKEHLLPLLLAGQAMRDIWPERTKVPWPVAWDAALAAAQGQPEKESRR